MQKHMQNCVPNHLQATYDTTYKATFKTDCESTWISFSYPSQNKAGYFDA
jgi:hypothetical protein